MVRPYCQRHHVLWLNNIKKSVSNWPKDSPRLFSFIVLEGAGRLLREKERCHRSLTASDSVSRNTCLVRSPSWEGMARFSGTTHLSQNWLLDMLDIFQRRDLMETWPKAVATEIIGAGGRDDTYFFSNDRGMKRILNIYNYTNRLQLLFTFVREACYCRW